MCGNSSARHVQLSISTCSFIFIRRSPSLHSFESPLWRSVSPLPISLSSPPISSLYSFHLTTPMAHPHSISSYTLQFRPCFSFTAAFCLHKTQKKCNSALLLQSFSALIFKYNTPLEGFPQNNSHGSADILVPFHTMLAINCNLKCFRAYFFLL